ncbi:MAG: hypothetical protein O3A20_08160 [Planctomycetota bacterium]|nr:hypothetical protein [Planctomycetota bacterium]
MAKKATWKPVDGRKWRDDGGLFEKFPGGVAAQQRLLKAEGHSFLRGKWVPKAHA